MKLTKKEIKTIQGLINIELKMCEFLKGFYKGKSSYEVNLEKLLNKFISFSGKRNEKHR